MSFTTRLPSVEARHARRQPQARDFKRRARHPVPPYNEAIKHVTLHAEDGAGVYEVTRDLVPLEEGKMWKKKSARVVVVKQRARRDALFWRDGERNVWLQRPGTGEILIASRVRRIWVDFRRSTGLYELIGLRVAGRPLNPTPYLEWIQPSTSSRGTGRRQRTDDDTTLAGDGESDSEADTEEGGEDEE